MGSSDSQGLWGHRLLFFTGVWQLAIAFIIEGENGI